MANSMYRNSGFYFIAVLVLALIGFWPSYFSKPFESIDFYVHFHATTMVLWIFMLISQAFLIRYKKFSLHKLIGKYSYALVPLIIISLVLLAHHQITIRENDITPSRLYILFLQLSLLLLFIICYCMAIIHRHNPARHSRYMICTALPLLDPAIARIPLDIPALPFSYQVITFLITDLILVLLIIRERHQNKAREVYPYTLILFIFFQALNLTSTNSVIWHYFSIWFARLPIT